IDNLEGIRSAFNGLKGECGKRLQTISMWASVWARIAVVIGLTQFLHLLDPLLAGTLFGSSRHLILASGGVFLIFCGFNEIKSHMSEGDKLGERAWSTKPFILLGQVLLVDLVLSVDSIVVAISVSSNLLLIVCAMVIAQLIIAFLGDKIESFFVRHRSFLTVIMAFIVFIGVVSLIRGMGLFLAEECLIAALLFGLAVEWLNTKRGRMLDRQRKKRSGTQNACSYDSVGDIQELPTNYVDSEVSPLFCDNFRLDATSETSCRTCQSALEVMFPFCIRCGALQFSESPANRVVLGPSSYLYMCD
ncbi:MAG: hypothetical protein K8F91_03080, partial [Candidatus Obscuribacterales bacterium]|nr:hypothetical protein [Candidatus Obscuribacterales bacterium]